MRHFEFGWKTRSASHIYAQGWEPNKKPIGVICLVHGLGEHGGRYKHVAEFFNEAGYAFLSFDQCGHGKSDGPRGHAPSYEAMMEHIARLSGEAQHRYPSIPLFLYGHSMGGNLVINHCLYAKAKVAGVIVTGPAFKPAFDPPAWKLSIGKFLYDMVPTLSLSNELDLQGLSRDPDVINAYNDDPLVHDRISARLGIDIIHTGEWVSKHAADFTEPMLLMHGGADRLTSAPASEEFAKKLKKVGDLCTLKIWPGLYHEIHNEPEKEEVLGFMLDWIKKRT